MTQKTKVDTTKEINEDLLYLEELKRRKKIIEEEIADMQALLAKEVDPHQTGNNYAEITDEKTGVRMKATCVRSENLHVDLAKLRERNPEAYRAITRVELDTKAYQRAVNAKVMRNSDMKETVSYTSSRPYFKFSRYGKPVDDEVDTDLFDPTSPQREEKTA